MLSLVCILINSLAAFNSETTDTGLSLPVARDAVPEEDAVTSSTSGAEVTQGSLSSSGITRNRGTPSSKSEVDVGLVGNGVHAKTREGDPLEAETESFVSQLKVFYFSFALFLLTATVVIWSVNK